MVVSVLRMIVWPGLAWITYVRRLTDSVSWLRNMFWRIWNEWCFPYVLRLFLMWFCWINAIDCRCLKYFLVRNSDLECLMASFSEFRLIWPSVYILAHFELCITYFAACGQEVASHFRLYGLFLKRYTVRDIIARLVSTLSQKNVVLEFYS